MDVPDQKGRFDILKVHAKNKKLAAEVELLEVALRTPGFSGADLANLLNEAAILTGRRSKQARRTASQNTKGPAGRRELPQRVARVRAMRCAARAAVCVAGRQARVASGAGGTCWTVCMSARLCQGRPRMLAGACRPGSGGGRAARPAALARLGPRRACVPAQTGSQRRLRAAQAISNKEIDDSVDRIVAGMEGTPMVDGKSKSLVAYHEVGHAICGTLTPGHDAVQKARGALRPCSTVLFVTILQAGWRIVLALVRARDSLLVAERWHSKASGEHGY